MVMQLRRQFWGHIESPTGSLSHLNVICTPRRVPTRALDMAPKSFWPSGVREVPMLGGDTIAKSSCTQQHMGH